MNLIHTIILSIIEGITEFLPISSTGHLILTSHLLQIPETEFAKSFEIIIQLGAILAVLLYEAKTLWHKREFWKPIIIAFIPTGILGLTLYKLIKVYLLGNSFITLLMLFVGGLILIGFEKYYKPTQKVSSISKLTLTQAILIGLAQSVSMIPGVSRSAATIIGGMLVGLNRTMAVEFSFMLAIPTMFAASGLDLLKSGFSFTSSEWTLLMIGFMGAFITALIAIKYFLKYVKSHDLSLFGYYRIALAIIFYLLFLR